MKLIGITVLIALAFASCTKPVTQREPEATPEPLEPGLSASTAKPIAAITPPPAAPVLKLAPEGVFYLLAAARVETADGVFGLTPGTGVKQVRPGVYLTPHGEAELRDDQVTNDLDRARAARDAALAGQSAVKQREAEKTTQAREAGMEAHLAHQATLSDMKRKQVETRLSALERQQQQLNTLRAELSDKQSREKYREIYKGRSVISDTDGRLKATYTQIKTVEDQIHAAREELRKMQ